jgi:hypothetical protein
VRENLCRAFFLGRTAKILFAVRLLHGARQKKTFGKKLFSVRFYLNARQRNTLPCVFFLAHGKHFFLPHQMLPSITTVSLHVIFAVRLYLCRALGQGARQRQFLCRTPYENARQTISLPCVSLQCTAKYFLKI